MKRLKFAKIDGGEKEDTDVLEIKKGYDYKLWFLKLRTVRTKAFCL